MTSREYEIQTRKNALSLLEIDKVRITKELNELTQLSDRDGVYGKLPNPLHERSIISILSRRLRGVTRTYICREPIQKNYAVWRFDFDSMGNTQILTGSETADMVSLGYYIGGFSDHRLYINKL